MSYFHKSEHCISPAINPPADCRNQADGAEPRQNEAVVGHPALLDILKTFKRAPRAVPRCVLDGERAATSSWKHLEPGAAKNRD